MGLDMYLTGENHLPQDWQNPENNQHEEGYRLKSRSFDLGYWRKHPDLHGFIVENFADGNGDCRPIPLNGEDLEAIIEAVKEGKLPKTTGFFFSESTNDDHEKTEDVRVLTRALQWMRADDWHRSIYYRASW